MTQPAASGHGLDYLLIELESALLISGGPTPGVHAATVRRLDGLPYLPASALKGAIREQLSRLAGEATARSLFGGEGVGSGGEKGDSERPGGGTSRCYFGDGRLISDRALFENGSAYAVRTQVSIDRARRRAADQHLFLRETVAPSVGVRFLAEIDTSRLTAEERRQLVNVARAVFGIGAGKSCGLGAVRLELLSPSELLAKLGEWPALFEAPVHVRLPAGEDFELIFEAIDPLCLGTDRQLGNFRRSRDFLPAQTLRGALITAGLEALAGGPAADRSGEPDFRRAFLAAETCVRFSDGRILAAKPNNGDPVEPWSRTPPLTLHACKAHGAQHGKVDLLVTEYLRSLAATRRAFAAPELRCPVCEGKEKLAPWRRATSSPGERRVLTRLGMDRASGRGQDGQLFSLEVLEPGTCFQVLLRGVGEAARPVIEAALGRDLRVGRGRGQGYGRLRCIRALSLPAGDSPLSQRLAHFDQLVRHKLVALAARLGCPPAELGVAERHLALWLQSDLRPDQGPSEGLRPGPEEALLATLGLAGEAEIVGGDLRLEARGGWNALEHQPKDRLPVIVAGSVALLRTRLELAELAERLAPCEKRGAGAGRELGYGWIRVSDPIHDPNWK